MRCQAIKCKLAHIEPSKGVCDHNDKSFLIVNLSQFSGILNALHTVMWCNSVGRCVCVCSNVYMANPSSINHL